jgi:hypothetical protein
MTAEDAETPFEFRAFVANCLMGGSDLSDTPEGSIRDLVVFECAGRKFQFRQKLEVIAGNLASLIGNSVETTEVIVSGVCEPDLEAVKLAVERICWLLSFAGTCRVIPFGYEYPNGSGLQNWIPFSGVAERFRPVFKIHDGNQVKKFVERVYDKYVALEGSRNLKVVFDYLAQAEAPGQLLEIKVVLSFVALENLKYTFAEEENIPFEKGQFRKSGKVGKKLGEPWHFKDLVEKMLIKVSMTTYDLTAAYALRNDLVHSGLSRETHDCQRVLYEGVHDLVREYLLRLLNYQGHYCPYDFKQRGDSVELK